MPRKGPYIKDTPRPPKHMYYKGRKIRYIRSAHDVRMAKLGHASARVGKVLSRGIPYIGWALLAYEAYSYVKSREIPYEVAQSTPKLPYDLEPYIQTPEYQYSVLTGYEDDGPVHWSRTV